MNNIKVKICGITNLQDAMVAIDCGADALGFVFFEKSARYCNPEKAHEIVRQLPPFISVVGLFVDGDKDTIQNILDKNFLNVLQFHGSESSAYCSSFNFPFIKVIPAKKDLDITKYSTDFIDAKAFLIDTFDSESFGGTGKTFDWSLIPKNLAKPLIIAGGLNEKNVVELINLAKPYAVDVSGGVEDGQKGIKDKILMKTFIKAVKYAEL